MSPRRRRSIVALPLAAAVIVLGGCGGDEERDYARAYDGACGAIHDAGEGVTSSVGKSGQDAGAAVRGLKGSVGRLLDAFDRGVDEMAAASAPKRFQDFQRTVETSKDETHAAIARAKAGLAAARTAADVGRVGTDLAGVKIGGGTIPKDLLSAAPACRTLGLGTTPG